MIEEIKASILSSLSATTKPDRCVHGVVNVFNASDVVGKDQSDAGLTTVTLGWHQVGISGGSGGGGGQQRESNTRAPYDLILLTALPVALPMTAQSAQRHLQEPIEGRVHLLALVTDTKRGSKGSGQGVTIKADKRAWDAAVQALSQRCPTGNKDAPLTQMISTPKGQRMAYRMSFTIVDQLTSYWREFFALHDFRTSKPPLLPYILSSPQSLQGVQSYSRNSDVTPDFRPGTPDFSGFDCSPTPSGFSMFGDTPESALDPFRAGTSSRTVWPRPPPGITNKVLEIFQGTFNEAQVLSIRTASEKRSGVTLVQGPPGTGKTTTVIGMLNAIHLIEYHNYYELLLNAVLGPEGKSCRNYVSTNRTSAGVLPPVGLDHVPWVQLVARVAKSKPHMLVAAPSNVAVDNIVLRILDRGFIDGSGNKYRPNIIRVGKSDAVKSVSLEEIVEGETGKVASGERQQIKAQVEEDMLACAEQIYNLQTLLLNFGVAFEPYYKKGGLPTGWELRWDVAAFRPLWVDHINQRATHDPPLYPSEPDLPPPPMPGKNDEPASPCDFNPLDSSLPPVHAHDYGAAMRAANPAARGGAPPSNPLAAIKYSSHRTLPEFCVHATSICRLLEDLDRLKLKHTRWVARINPDAYGGPMEAKQAIETSCLDTAHVVFSTLNGTGSPVLEMADFQLTLIDEAGQCSEPSLLIALRKRCKQCIMVGDPKQLPATIFSDAVKRRGYDQSLFERLMINGNAPIFLDVQYRMGPEISSFPSGHFYEHKLRDGGNVLSPTHYPEYVVAGGAGFNPSTGRFTLDPFLFFDLYSSSDSGLPPSFAAAAAAGAAGAEDGEEEGAAVVASNPNLPSGGQQPAASRRNPQEALLCLSLLQTLLLASAASGGAGSVGVITPYNEQLSELKRVFGEHGLRQGEALGPIIEKLLRSLDHAQVKMLGTNLPQFKRTMQGGTLDLELNTVDGFQGKEKDFIIISCVRANDFGSIGFLSDTRRMNVALTRAKFGLYVVGNADTLQSNADWNSLLEHAAAGNRVVPVHHPKADIMKLLMDHQALAQAEAEAQVQAGAGAGFGAEAMAWAGEGTGAWAAAAVPQPSGSGGNGGGEEPANKKPRGQLESLLASYKQGR